MADVESSIVTWLEKEIATHLKWRRLWSVFYFTGAAITVISGALAAASAGFMDTFSHGPVITALLAALATISASLEKVLRLREKWDLHRNVQMVLEMINLRVAAGLIDTGKTVELIERAAQTYSLQLAELNAAGMDNSRS